MIKGPWPIGPNGLYIVPLEGSTMTPMYRGEKVAIRVSASDKAKLSRGPGFKGNVTDLETGKTYALHGRPCSLPRCYCDAELVDLPESAN